MSWIVGAQLVRRVEMSDDISSFTLAATDGPLRGCEAGAHIDVHLPNGMIRNYSLTDWDVAGAWVSIAVKKEPAGRGGSIAMHSLGTGELLPIAGPRNNFPLVTDSEPIVLLGAGIGITPLYAMASVLQDRGSWFDLHYLVRTRALAAFDDSLVALGLGDRYHLHCDDVDGQPDFMDLLERYPQDTHYYVCGPEVMLNAVRKASEERGRGTVFFERFAGATGIHDGAERAFRVALSSTGEELEIPADKSILQVLREAGHDLDYACSEGVCGTCIVDVLDGEVDHRDSVLTEDEQLAGDCMCVCVSRARCARLVLDL